MRARIAGRGCDDRHRPKRLQQLDDPAVFEELLPIFAKDILTWRGQPAGELGLGLLRSAEALGALGMAIVLAHRPPIARAGRTLLVVVALFGLGIVAFGLPYERDPAITRHVRQFLVRHAAELPRGAHDRIEAPIARGSRNDMPSMKSVLVTMAPAISTRLVSDVT